MPVASFQKRSYDAGVVARNSLGDLDIEKASELKPAKRKKRKRYEKGVKSRIAYDVRAGQRKPPPVPKNKSLAEITEMDPDSVEFKHPEGGPRKTYEPDKRWYEGVQQDKQKRHRERRARARKYEAEVTAAVRVLERHVRPKDVKMGVFDEDKAVAEGILALDDWSTEELIRGYRKGRNGKFGPPPKFIPREVQQAAFRALVNRGDKRLKEAYYESVDELADLATNASSEKVKLEAIKELMNRVVGKVADKVMIAREEPWEGVLADSLVPLGEVPAFEMEVSDDGVARALPPGEDEWRGDGEDTLATGAAPEAAEVTLSPPNVVVSEVTVIPAKPKRKGAKRADSRS